MCNYILKWTMWSHMKNSLWELNSNPDALTTIKTVDNKSHPTLPLILDRVWVSLACQPTKSPVESLTRNVEFKILIKTNTIALNPPQTSLRLESSMVNAQLCSNLKTCKRPSWLHSSIINLSLAPKSLVRSKMDVQSRTLHKTRVRRSK